MTLLTVKSIFVCKEGINEALSPTRVLCLLAVHCSKLKIIGYGAFTALPPEILEQSASVMEGTLTLSWNNLCCQSDGVPAYY